MSTETIDLHGIEGQPFPDWDEEEMYLERVTLPDEAAARKRIADEYKANIEELDRLLEIYMCWVKPEEAADGSNYAIDGGWLECPADHPAAVPFWKDCP